MTFSNVILVHGAWADGSHWTKIIPLLAAKGMTVAAVQLPLTSFEADVAAVSRAIALAQAQLHILPGVGHLSPLEAPGALAKLIRCFAQPLV